MLSFLAMTLISVVSAVVTSRLYGVHIIGQFALVSAPVLALWVLSTAKEQSALIREITVLPPRHPRVTQLFAAVFTFSSGLTVAMSILGAIVSWLVFRGPLHDPDLVDPVFVSLAGYAIITNTGWNIDSIFSAFVAGRQLFWVRLHETLSFLLLAMLVGLVWHSVWGLVVATIGGSLTALLHRMVLVRHFVRVRVDIVEYLEGLRVLPSLLRFGLKITPGGIAQGISQQAGIWAIGLVSSVGLVGAYSRAETLPGRLQQVNFRIVEVLYPTLVARRATGDGDGFDRALIDTIRYALVGMLLIAALCGGAAKSILDIFGPGFSRAAPALELLAAYPALATVTVAQTQAFYAINRPGLTSVIAVARLAVTITLTVVLTPRVGITGPAIALLAGYAAQVTWGTIALVPALSKPLHTIWPRREGLALVASYLVGLEAATVAERVLPGITGLPLSLLAGTAAYVSVAIVCGAVNARDRDRLTEAVGTARAWRDRRLAEAS
ncbi:MAG TPA: oligosaccharide flippase family protein [Solirubrobacteraceae bacterium]|jgi:O-antigen/teichoic acid export membrane protein|nr:oligosaccharide flippase family protein [Solirubrobacteraceae bacterium]